MFFVKSKMPRLEKISKILEFSNFNN